MALLLDLKSELVNYFSKVDNNFLVDSNFLLENYINPLTPAPSTYKETDENQQKRQLRHEVTELLERYINLSKRRFAFQGSKKVFRSQEICQKLNDGTLSKEICNTIAKIKYELEKGDDVHARLSTLIENLNFDDKLLNDWNIYHFHLSDIDNIKSGFKKRTGELLFVYMPFHSDSVYFLDVSPTHMFCRLDLLDLINKNWPDLLNDFKINGISNPKGIAKSDNEYSALRKSNSNSIIYLPSTNEFIIAPGLGLTFGGTSIANQESAIRIIKRITELDRKFFQNTSVQLLLKDNYIIVENPQENVKEEINIYYCD